MTKELGDLVHSWNPAGDIVVDLSFTCETVRGCWQQRGARCEGPVLRFPHAIGAVAELVRGQVKNGDVVLDAMKPLSVEVGLVKRAVFFPGPFDDE